MIPAIKISDNPEADENEAVALIVGGYHAREWLAINFVYLLMEYLLVNKEKPAIKWHLDNSEIWIVPLLNSDGRVFDESGGSPQIRGAKTDGLLPTAMVMWSLMAWT